MTAERRQAALAVLDELRDAGLITYTLDETRNIEQGGHLQVFATGEPCTLNVALQLSDRALIAWYMMTGDVTAAPGTSLLVQVP